MLHAIVVEVQEEARVATDAPYERDEWVGRADEAICRDLRSRFAPRSPRRRRLARGQAIVEFSLVAPLFFALIFGLLEFSLIGASISAYNLAAKDGARIGSLLGRTDATVDQQIVADVRARTSGIVPAKALKIEIFEADVTGQPVTGGNGTIENVYDINGNPIGAQNWPVSSRRDQLLNADYLGVRITFLYTYLTDFISGGNSTLQLTSASVQRIEPQDYQSHRVPTPSTALALNPSIAIHASLYTNLIAPRQPRFADRRWLMGILRSWGGMDG